MRYRITDTHLNINLRAPKRHAGRLLACGRLAQMRGKDIVLQLVTYAEIKDKCLIAWRVCIRQRSVIQAVDLINFYQLLLLVDGVHLDNSSFVYIP